MGRPQDAIFQHPKDVGRERPKDGGRGRPLALHRGPSGDVHRTSFGDVLKTSSGRNFAEWVLARLPVLAVQINAGNNSYQLKNKTRKMLYFLYQYDKNNEKLYDNLIKSL